MAQIPEDIKEGIKKLAEVTELPTKSLLARLKEIIDTDENIQAMEKEDFKIRFAWAKLYSENSSAGKTTDFLIMPISSPRARKIKLKGDDTYVGDLSAFVRKLEKDDDGKVKKGDFMYASGTFWREGAKNLNNVEKGKVYKTALITKDNSWGIGISSDRAGFLPSEEKFPSIKELYDKLIAEKNINITIGEMDLNKSEDTTDIRVIEATVIEATVGESDDGNEYGRYVVMDDSIMGNNFVIFVDAKDVDWSQGSILKFGGTIDINDETGVIRWRNHFIIPTDLAMPKQLEVKPVSVKQETVDITEEPPREEKKKETKKEEKEEVDLDKEFEDMGETDEEIDEGTGESEDEDSDFAI